MEYTDEQFRALAAQLSRPEGEMGIEVGLEMNRNNAPMIVATIESLKLSGGEHLLELGHGIGSHIPDLLSRADGLQYTGLEISELMYSETQKHAAMLDAKTDFHLYSGNHLPLADSMFDRIMTVNTVYFWKDPVTMVNEMYRVLRPGGTAHIAYGQERSMARMPFTQYGFQLYDTPKMQTLLDQLSWNSIRFDEHTDRIAMGPDEFLEREFTIVIATK